MKRAFNSLALALLVACATTPKIPANRHGLQVVPDLATYERITRADPSKRLVDLQSFVPGIVLDIRYATTNNFMHQQPKDNLVLKIFGVTTAGPRSI